VTNAFQTNENLNLNFLNELNSTKRLLKNSLENQSEFQTKLIEYNRIISDQENIIRLNNIKLSEHDSKLTEILMTFNNYLQLNDKTTKIVNDLTNKYEKIDEFVKKNEFSDFKSLIYNINRNNDSKNFENFNKLEELHLKTAEISKEQEMFQKYSMEKFKLFQNESMENRIAQQQQLIKLEETRENKMNQQLDSFKIMIKILEKNISNEASYRKNMIENSHAELIQAISKRDEKISFLEKTQLETEKKLINFNKEYMTTFQELIIKHNQKYEIEIKSLKSIFENRIINLNLRFEEKVKEIDQTFQEIKSSYNQAILTELYNQLENSTNEKYSNLDTKLGSISNDTEQNKIKIASVSTTLSKFMKENIILIDNKLEIVSNLQDEKLNRKINEVSCEINTKLESSNSKTLGIIDDKIGNALKLISNTPSENSINPDYKLLNEKLINDKMQMIQSEIEEFEKKFLLLMNLHIDGIKKKINDEQSMMLNNISEKLESKINLLKSDIKEKNAQDEFIKEGRIQEYVVESENRIKKNLEIKINNIQQELDNITIKLAS